MPQNRDYDVIVIGGGHNGLVCAGYLARAGQDVLVLERRPFVGGAAVTEELFPGYRLSSCSYLCHVLQAKIIDDLELRKFGFEVFPLDPARFQPYPDGRSLLIWDSVAATQESIGQFSARDAAAWPRWLEFWKRAAGLIYPYFLTSPPTLAEMFERVRGTDDEQFLERLLTVSMKELLHEYFEDPAVQAAFVSAQDVGDPAAAGSAWCYAYIRCDMFSRPEDVGIVKGGMGTVSEALAASARTVGVTIQTDSSVKSIIVEGGTAVGVEFENGESMAARTIVSNCDPKRTFALIEPQYLPAEFQSCAGRLRTNCGYLKFHAALKRLPDFSRYFHGEYDPHYLAYMKICPSVEYFEESWRDARRGLPARAPVMEVQIPSVVDPTLAAPGRHVLSVWGMYAPVRPAGGNWDELRQEAGESLIDILSEYAADFRDCIVDWSLFTPADLEQRVGLTDGNIRHLDMVPDQYLASRPLLGWADYATPLKNLYLCGAGTHPGGEVTGAPGHNAAGRILRDGC